jgi:hypothetical protein
MFQGMTIENLMASVERAEQHAREQQQTATFDPAQEAQTRPEWQPRMEMMGVA